MTIPSSASTGGVPSSISFASSLTDAVGFLFLEPSASTAVSADKTDIDRLSSDSTAVFADASEVDRFRECVGGGEEE